ncbi:MAG: UDP-N-acetylglucosamine--N-acetylmuramyl-(pentapeptide) pyrophosphoryl-undecaprenol N-acetylglucosamine transferase [Chloroflexi bacterium]|nr:MAG: UDP-N-acetylglucosamine--N-acetylmuramyl-(pentapeptide) pyrophosphoryl-undecaprenol N-acetylglucosamine transferase [Chloroflexota bacterium]TMD51364.1 MAG: UDP-N-acetylglucosamine--N-acetylmuramyl-(pentapeptide) pyrophosphoryl-undecaprenol N-acetylglucosamine transferase [Chloroflexota bacterium]
MRLLISGGGTGGHLMPALAVAQAFRAEEPEGAVLLVGKAGGPEERLVPKAGFELETIRIQGLNRDAPLKNLALPAVLPAAMRRGGAIVEAFRPDVVLGVGGYASVPALWAARRRGIPYVLHEQNVQPGLATRMFATGAAAVCVTFPGTRVKAVRTAVTGLPLREGFSRRTPRVPVQTLLVTGGSQGARRINEAVWSVLDGLLRRFPEVIHLTGRQGAADATRLARPGYRPYEFNSDVAGLLREADLVVSRAGVSTLAEITAVGLPSILVPGSFGGGHQEANARSLVESGAAVMILDRELTGERLLAEVDALDEGRLRALAEGSARLGRQDAAQQVLGFVREAVR